MCSQTTSQRPRTPHRMEMSGLCPQAKRSNEPTRRPPPLSITVCCRMGQAGQSGKHGLAGRHPGWLACSALPARRNCCHATDYPKHLRICKASSSHSKWQRDFGPGPINALLGGRGRDFAAYSTDHVLGGAGFDTPQLWTAVAAFSIEGDLRSSRVRSAKRCQRPSTTQISDVAMGSRACLLAYQTPDSLTISNL